MINIPVSFGELFDKYTILQIKNENITEPFKLSIVQKELAYLQKIIKSYTIDSIHINNLKEINKSLWNIEDKIREKERLKVFDEEFISLARAVYITNDERSRVKNVINTILNSEIIDIKSYARY
jgi:hypothetical protein